MSSNSSVSNHKTSLEHEEIAPSRVKLTGSGDEIVILGGKQYYRHDLMTAFAGTLNPDRFAVYPKHEIANAAAYGLAGHGLSTFVLGLYYCGAHGITIPNAIVSLSCFYGGVAENLAGIFELYNGNTFAACAFCGYGCFWFSFAAIFIDSFGISAAYKDPDELNNAIGLFCMGWALFSFMLTAVTLKATLAFFCIFFFLFMTFLILAIANFTGSAALTKAGGVFCLLASFSGWYCCFAGIATPFNSYFIARDIPLPIVEGNRKSK